MTPADELEVRIHGVLLRSGFVALEIDGRARYGPASAISMGPGLEARSFTTATFDHDGLPWDGELHAYVALVDDQRFGPWFVALPEHDTPRPWWIVAAAGAAAIGLVAIAIWRSRRRTGAARA